MQSKLFFTLTFLISSLYLFGQDVLNPVADPVLQDLIQRSTVYQNSDGFPASTSLGKKNLEFPWLFLSQKQWNSLSSYLTDPYFKDIHERNLKSLEKLGGDQFNKKNPDFTLLTNSISNPRVLKNWVERATVAWYITGERRYFEMATAALQAACHSEDWIIDIPGRFHINGADLGTAELTYVVAFGYDALFNYLDESLKRTCTKTLTEKGLRTYLKGIALNDWWVHCDFNWNSALHGNAGIAALIIRNINPELSDYVLQRVTDGLPYMIKSFYPDGGYIEGVMYQGTAIAHLTDFIVPFAKLTGKDLGLMKNKAFHETISFWAPMFAPDGYAYNFSDCSEKGAKYGIAHTYWWANQLDRPDWTWDQDRRTSQAVGAGGLFHDVEAFWYRQPHQKSSPPELNGFRHFKGIDWITWRGEQSWLAFRAGFNGGNHDNDDLGHIILGYGKDRFLIDPGYGAINASQHNCITLRSHEQTDGATGFIRKAFETKNGFYLVSELKEAFPYIASKYNRHLLMINDKHLLMIDEIRGVGDNRVGAQGHLQTRYPVTRTDNGWMIEGPTQKCSVDFLFDFGQLIQEPWSFNGPITKLIYRNMYDRVHAIQPVLFRFDDTPYTYSFSKSGFNLEINGKTYEFRYQNGELVYLQEEVD
ncbi:MAG: heparinase II/III family protein [Mariniphaga sp.]|nr:heparinase II/III family protein [Mariniphaga sp.]